MRFAGIISGADMALQPLPRQLVGGGVGTHAEADGEFPIHDFKTVWRFATHGGEHKQNLWR